MKKLFIILTFCFLAVLSSVAKEGMWMLTQLKQLDLKKKGLKIPIEDIYSTVMPNLNCSNKVLRYNINSTACTQDRLIQNEYSGW